MKHITKEEVIKILQQSYSISDAFKRTKISVTVLRRLVSQYSINTSVVCKQREPHASTVKQITRKCLQCGVEFTSFNLKKLTCGASCSNRYFRPTKSKEIRAKISAGGKIALLAKGPIKKYSIRLCAWDGITQTPSFKHKIAIKNAIYYSRLNFLYSIGFNKAVLGTPNVNAEYDRVVAKLFDEYFIKKESTPVLAQRYNIHESTIRYQLQTIFNRPLRTLIESMQNACIQGRSDNSKFKSGFHSTFDGKIVHYRSSYELEYYKMLDEQKEPYEVEFKFIKYFDHQKLVQRYAIPDIYIPRTNTIIEIKSSWTYDYQNMFDRYMEYIKHYNFKLIYNKKEYDKPIIVEKKANITHPYVNV